MAESTTGGIHSGRFDPMEFADQKSPAYIRAFIEYNGQKAEFLYSRLTRLKKIVYDVVPLLIQAEVKCGPDGERVSHRIARWRTSPRAAQSFARAFPRKTPPRDASDRDSSGPAPIECLALIGSMGAVAQNNKSDFDYWVCVDKDRLDDRGRALLRDKLRAVERWAAGFARAEVHFFIMDLDRVRRNDFGRTGGESTGSAMGNLLKEEFYRSMTLIGGRVPLWWAMPPGVSGEQYGQLARALENSPRIERGLLVDMGNLQPLSLAEFHGAAVWQIGKTIGSPFKSVLKMAVLEEYIMNRGAGGLLADDLKRRLISGRGTERDLDPYVIMLDRAVRFLEDQGRRLELNLLRQCFFLKVGEPVDPGGTEDPRAPKRRRIMAELVREWEWKPGEIERLARHHLWSFEESHRFSELINGYMFRTFDRIKDEVAAAGGGEADRISDRDLKLLESRLFAFYSSRPNKVESIKNVIENPPVLSAVTIQREDNSRGLGGWGLYRGLYSREKGEAEGARRRLFESAHLTEGLAWLVNNRLWGRETTININPGKEPLAIHATAADIQGLLADMKRFFPPYRYRDLPDEVFLREPTTLRMMLVVNLNEPDRSDDIGTVSVCRQNNWGEIFFHGYEDYLEGTKLARRFIEQRIGGERGGVLTRDLKVFLSGRHQTRPISILLSRYLGVEADW